MAAEQGDYFAQDILAGLYLEDRGVAQDYLQAHMWFNLAAARIPAAQSVYRSLIVEKRDGLAAKMPPGQIAEAQRLARDWKPK